MLSNGSFKGDSRQKACTITPRQAEKRRQRFIKMLKLKDEVETKTQKNLHAVIEATDSGANRVDGVATSDSDRPTF